MGIIRVYADTSVFGGLFDEEFKVPSQNFFDQVKNGVFALVTSAIVQDEIALAPPEVMNVFDECLKFVMWLMCPSMRCLSVMPICIPELCHRNILTMHYM